VVVLLGTKYWQPLTDQQFKQAVIFQEQKLTTQTEINKFCIELPPLDSE
jgi:hypothetical protein